MARHIDNSFYARNHEMARCLAAVRALTKHFLGITVQAILRAKNEATDELAKMASST